MDSQTSLKTSQREGCNPLNPPPGSASVLRKRTSPGNCICCQTRARWSIDGQGQSIYSPLILRVWPNLKKYHFLNYELINLVFFSSYCFYYYLLLLLLLLLLLGGVPFGNGNENIFALNFRWTQMNIQLVWFFITFSTKKKTWRPNTWTWELCYDWSWAKIILHVNRCYDWKK